MKRKGFSAITVAVCAIACCFMLGIIIKDYVIPIINGTIAELPEGKAYTPDDIPAAIAEFVDTGAERYAYQQLSENQQEAYRLLLTGSCAFAERIDIKRCNISIEELRVIYSCIRNDYPELFWVYNNCEVYSTGDTATDCLPHYIYDKNSTIQMIGNIEQVKEALLSPIKDNSDYEKVMYVFDYIIDSTDYDMDSYNDYLAGNITENLERSCSIYGTLIGRKALCEGYSKTMQYLLNSMDIECLYITGVSEGEGHAWNYIKLDGSYYGMDITWCDPKSDTEIKSYAYCLVDYDTLRTNHTEDVPYELPECSGGQYNYYKYNGYELSVFDLREVEGMLYKAYAEGRAFAEIHCSDQHVYDSFLQAIESQEIFDCFGSIERNFGKHYGAINYGVIEDARAIRISL